MENRTLDLVVDDPLNQSEILGKITPKPYIICKEFAPKGYDNTKLDKPVKMNLKSFQKGDIVEIVYEPLVYTNKISYGVNMFANEIVLIAKSGSYINDIQPTIASNEIAPSPRKKSRYE